MTMSHEKETSESSTFDLPPEARKNPERFIVLKKEHESQFAVDRPIIEMSLEDKLVADAHKKLREMEEQDIEDQPGGERGIYNDVDYADWCRRDLEKKLGKKGALEHAVFLAEYSESISKSRVHLGMANTDEAGQPHWANDWQGGMQKVKEVDVNGNVTEIIVNLDRLENQNKYIVARIREELELDKDECPDLTEELQPGQQLDRKNKTHRLIIASQMHANMGYRMGRGNAEQWVANLGAAEILNQYSDPSDITANEGSVYGKPHEVGLFIWKRMPGAYSPSIERTRQFQGRAVKDVGIFYDKKYTASEVKQQEEIAQRAKEEGRTPPPVWIVGLNKIDLEQFYRAWSLNSASAFSFLSRTGWTNDQARHFADVAIAGWDDFQLRRLKERGLLNGNETIEDAKRKKLLKDIGHLIDLPDKIDKANKPST